jgi:hypothetical protein
MMIWLILGLILLIPCAFIVYILNESINNSEKDNTVNPNFKKNKK